MGTKRRGTARSKTGPGTIRPRGRISRNRLEKIPIPPVPAFLQSATRAPGKKQDPGTDPTPGADSPDPISPDPISPDPHGLEVISPGAISEEEADLLLGMTSSAAADRPRPAHENSPLTDGAGAGAPERPEGALTTDEADELLGLAPGPAVPAPDGLPQPARPVTPVAPARSGASGATVLNELVDEIEKDLERDLDRHAPSLRARRYATTIGCWVAPLADASDRHPPETGRKKHQEGKR